MRYRKCVLVSSFAALSAILGSTSQGCATSVADDGSEFKELTATGADASAPPPTFGAAGCTNLQCKQASCQTGKPKTTVSGVVYDPAGIQPLYDAVVYVPNTRPAPITHGVTCDRCDTVTSGDPVVTALTDTGGRFVIEDVPAGDNIPLVIQIGKWRRQIVMPHVVACQDNPLEKEMTRLPRNQGEGDLPRIALSTGCDPMECLFRKMGIDDSEFTHGEGTGRVHLYRGNRGGGAVGSTSSYDLWPDADRLRKYDIVINACECAAYPRGADSYAAMHAYLDEGGRFFGSHFQYNWFTDTPGDFHDVADWTPHGECNVGPNRIDDTFPKGKAFAEWLMTSGGSEIYGEIPLSCAPRDVAATKPNLSQRWIYDGPSGSPSYVSFNTPVAANGDAQCGRAVFADLHVSRAEGGADSAGQLFPSGCKSTGMSPQEKALEFMFFDLSSCIRKDSDTPQAPPPK